MKPANSTIKHIFPGFSMVLNFLFLKPIHHIFSRANSSHIFKIFYLSGALNFLFLKPIQLAFFYSSLVLNLQTFILRYSSLIPFHILISLCLHEPQTSHFYLNAIWSGSFSVQGIRNIQMDHAQIEPLELATGKLLEKTGKWYASLR